MIFLGVSFHLRFGSVSQASLLLSGTRLVRDLRSIPSIQKEAEPTVLASDAPFSALTPRLRFSALTLATLYKLQNVPGKTL